jgi:hypothetical protein
LVGQSSAGGGLPEFGDSLHAWVVPEDEGNDRELSRVQIPKPSFYLVRPDGYVGLCGVRFDAVRAKDYLTRNLHLSLSRAAAAKA